MTNTKVRSQQEVRMQACRVQLQALKQVEGNARVQYALHNFIPESARILS